MDDQARLAMASLPRRRFGGVDADAVASLLESERARWEAEWAALRQRVAELERERDDAVTRLEAREGEMTSLLRVATEVAVQTTSRAQHEAETIRGDARDLHQQLAAYASAVQDLVNRWGPVLQGAAQAPVQPPPVAAAPLVAPVAAPVAAEPVTPVAEPTPAPAPVAPPEPYSMTLVATPLTAPEQAVEIERALVALPEVLEARLERLAEGEAHFAIVVTADLAGSAGLARLGSTVRSGLDGYVLVLGGDQATR